jgi:Flp pilus assembly pilin Flp
MTCWTRVIRRMRRIAVVGSERGAGLVEYAMLMALIAIVCFAAIGLLGKNTSNNFSVNAACFNAECTGP